MKTRELYQRTFSQVHFSGDIRWEDYGTRRPKRGPGRRLVLVAAVLALLAAISTAAVATDVFGLGAWLLPQPQEETQAGESGGPAPADTLSLMGYAATAESRAAAEWWAFLAAYDPDGTILTEVGNGPTGLEEKYALYSVYTQEMADKLEEIAAKYALTLHSRIGTVLPEMWDGTIGGFLSQGHTAYTGYIYEDGTFAYDGDAEVPGYGLTSYQLVRCVLGSFTEISLTVRDPENYREWGYTAGGVPVTLALGPNKGLILADLGDCFVTVNVLTGERDGFTEEHLETLAAGIDFGALSPVGTPPEAAFEEPAAPMSTLAEQEMFSEATGVDYFAAQEFYTAFYRAVENGDALAAAERVDWPRSLVTGQGETEIASAEEFLPHYGQVFTPGLLEAMAQNQYTEDRADLFYRDGLIGAAGGAVWFGLMEGELRVVTVQSPEGAALRYGGPAGVQPG